MIQSITLQNFQSHSQSLLELDPGINIIVGDSDSGKTAILRALNWVLTNRPTGDAFRRNGTEKTIVTVAVDNGSISRLRSNRENVYLDALGEKLAAIGTSVPESVTNLVRMDVDVNVQRQLDAPFLLSCSAGEVAQRLNTVVGLDDIDIGLSNAARRVKQNQATYEGVISQCASLEEQVSAFAYLEQMEQEVESLERISEDLLQISVDKSSLQNVLAGVVADQSALRLMPDMNRALLGVQQCEISLQNYNIIEEQVADLSACVLSIKQTVDSLAKLPDVLALSGQVEDVTSLLDQLGQLVGLKDAGTYLLSEREIVLRDFQKMSDELLECEERFHEEMSDACPLCGRKGK